MRHESLDRPRDRPDARQIEQIIRDWMDEPENRLSLEGGSYGDVEKLALLLATQLERSSQG
jgi:hypothetical protein